MKYTHPEVIDIIKSVTDQNPEELLKLWVDKKSNTPLEHNNYNNYIYSFPLIIGRTEVATITLADLYHNIDTRDDLMLKYFGREDFNKSWWTFSHDTYLDCYLTIHKQFELPEICKGLNGDTFQGIDANRKPFEFKISYGDPEKEEDSHYYYQWKDGGYSFDNSFSVQVNRMNGWILGRKINDNIETRLIPYKRDEKINTLIK
jgi:hypothetical protein